MASNWRIAVAFGFIGAMAITLILLLLDGDDEPQATPTTFTTVATTTTSTASPTATSLVIETTTTTLDPEARKAEVARIVEDLWIAWYNAIYQEEESSLVNIVAVQLLYDDAVSAMGNADFSASPNDDTVDVTVYSILLDRPDCLVVHFQRDLRELFGPESLRDGVQILWPQEHGKYRLARLWSNPSDLWQDDCDLMDRTEVP